MTEPAVAMAQGGEGIGPAQRAAPVTLASPSTLALIAANLIPVVGAFVYGWNVATLLVLYWAESAVIGFYTLLKLAVVGRWMVLLAGPFFLVHYGGIMGWFLGVSYMIFRAALGGSGSGGDIDAEFVWIVTPALIALVLSHGVSFVANFIGRREYEGRETKDLMLEPYKRVGPMLGMTLSLGLVVAIVGNSLAMLLVMILVKIVVDVRAHLEERRVSAGRTRGLVRSVPA